MTNTPLVFLVDSNIPIPLKGKPPGGHMTKFPWASMQVGDSFFVPARSHSSMAGTIASRESRAPHKYTSRLWTENSLAGIRVWRIE